MFGYGHGPTGGHQGNTMYPFFLPGGAYGSYHGAHAAPGPATENSIFGAQQGRPTPTQMVAHQQAVVTEELRRVRMARLEAEAAQSVAQARLREAEAAQSVMEARFQAITAGQACRLDNLRAQQGTVAAPPPFMGPFPYHHHQQHMLSSSVVHPLAPAKAHLQEQAQPPYPMAAQVPRVPVAAIRCPSSFRASPNAPVPPEVEIIKDALPPPRRPHVAVVPSIILSQRPEMTQQAALQHDKSLAGTSKPASGLDLLSTAATEPALLQQDSDSSTAASTAASSASQDGGKVYIDQVREWDVLCGRGGKSNHHPGNKRYRQVVAEMKRTYRSTDEKNIKTDVSRAIVEHVCAYGGRFIKKCEETGRYYVLTRGEARKKTSQALRETKALKWTI